MRYLITGGAGFIGSHLADELLKRGHEVFVVDDLSTGSIENIKHLKGKHRLQLRHRHLRERAGDGRAGRQLRPHLSPGRGGGREADRRVAGAHHRDQRPPHRGDVDPGQQEEAAHPGRLDQRGLRQERPVPVPRGRRSGAGRHRQGPLVLRLLQGHRRVPGHRLLEGAQAADGGRPPVQHRRAAPDRPVRHGHPQLRPPGAGRRAHHRLRRRPAVPLLHPRRRRRARR